MSTLVEQIEALRASSFSGGYVRDELNTILAAAHAQAQELAAMRSVCAEAYQMAGVYGAPVKALDNLSAAANGKPIPHETFLPINEQHDADLREVAEMARLFCKNIIINRCREHGNWKKDGAPSKILRYEASDLIDGLSADFIVREFREQKAKVGK